MVWKSAITYVEENKIITRGYRQEDLIGRVPFSHAVFLLWMGRLPTENEGKMMDALITACIDHGPKTPSILTPRIVAGCGVPFSTAVATGVLAIGDVHGGAIERCAYLLQEGVSRGEAEGKSLEDIAREIVSDFREKKKRIPGFGHRIHTSDPRAKRLFDLSHDLKIAGKHVELARCIEEELERAIGKKLPINVDGAIGAIISDMGFDYRLGKAFFIMGRVAGIVAHVYEEITREKPMRELCKVEYEYDGPRERDLSI